VLVSFNLKEQLIIGSLNVPNWPRWSFCQNAFYVPFRIITAVCFWTIRSLGFCYNTKWSSQ